MDKAKKITKATLKSFINKNRKNLFVLVESRFSGQSDMVENTGKTEFSQAEQDKDINDKRNFGVKSIWVTTDWNIFNAYDKDGFVGIACYNCVGSWIVAIKKPTPAVVAA